MSKGVKKVGSFITIELPEQDYDCPNHGAYQGKPLSLSVNGRIRTIDPQCPVCEKEVAAKLAAQEEDQRKRIKTIADENRIKALNEMNIGKKFWNETLETFKPYTNELKLFFDICVKFIENPEGRMLVMLGNHGNGKNHLATAILRKLGGFMYSVFEMDIMIRDSVGNHTELETYKKLCNAPLLVINEIGRYKPTEWGHNVMSYIINKRYENMMPLVLISNTHLKESCPERGCGGCLENYLRNDSLSRIIESGEIMIFTGEDYRLKIREAKGGRG